MISSKIKAARILLTLGALEFFGPILRDTNSSHLLNPEWVGHSRFHLMWCMVLWFGLGCYSLYLIWGKNLDMSKLYRALLLQAFNILAFWGAVVLGPLYAAQVFDASIHIGFMNVNENIIVFTGATILALVNLYLLKRGEQEAAQ